MQLENMVKTILQGTIKGTKTREKKEKGKRQHKGLDMTGV